MNTADLPKIPLPGQYPQRPEYTPRERRMVSLWDSLSEEVKSEVEHYAAAHGISKWAVVGELLKANGS